MTLSLKNLLKIDKDQELLQSYVRIDSETENLQKKKSSLSEANRKSSKKKSITFIDQEKIDKSQIKTESETIPKRKVREVFNDYYTDKDRAAAVSAGSYDIKQSLKIKKQQDRNEVLQIADEADISSLISLGLKEMKNANTENSITCFTKALELNKTDVNALVARSKCYLLLGEASKALEDAEMALTEEPSNMRALYQKAESLYYLGQFEQSLMFFHRVLRARPEMDLIRLGVQKTQEAIQNTIGTSKQTKTFKKSIENTPKLKAGDSQPRCKTKSSEKDKRVGRKLLGELRVDKDYLQNLLKNPDLKKGYKSTENVSNLAEEAVKFLDKREEFWRQQRPCSVLLSHKNMPQDEVPFWF